MDIVFCQPVTNKTVNTVRERYFSLGWGEVYLQATGSNIIELQFKWCKEEPFTLPEVSDLGLEYPHKL